VTAGPDGVVHLLGPVLLAAALAGIGVYGILARRNAVLVLVGAELLLNAANVLLVAGSSLPSGALGALGSGDATSGQGLAAAGDPLLGGQVMAIFVITIAAAEIGVALAIVLLLFRSRATSDLAAVRELGEASPTHTETPGAGTWPATTPSGGHEAESVSAAEPAPAPVPSTPGAVR
jgi:NADH-quinone oxidoreductase subunit K